jgi:hypothetical protein
MPTEQPPPAVVDTGGVYLRADLVFPLWATLRRELARHRADGGQVRPEMVTVMNALRTVALAHMSDHQQPDRTSAHHQDHDALVTTGELATRLGVTTRHVLRLAAEAGITRAAHGRWHPGDAAHLVRLRKDR